MAKLHHRLLVLPLILFSSIAYADTIGTTKIYYGGGKQSQTVGIDERDLKGAYTFHKYGVKVKAEPTKGFRYNAGYMRYEKNFDTAQEDLDNITNIFDVSFSAPVAATDKLSLRFNTNYQFRGKRYKNSPSTEYDENTFGKGVHIDFNKKHSLGLSGGIKDYDYIKNDSSSVTKYFLKASPRLKFMDGDFTLSGYYRRDWVDQAKGKKDYTEDCVSIRPSVKLDIPILYKMTGSFQYGRNDTRDSGEDREDNLRFEYKVWDVSSYYKFRKDMDNKLTYGQRHREYFTSISGYDDWYIKDRLKFALLKKEPFDLDMIIGAEHRETTFYENEAYSYIKGAVSGGFNLSRRADWSAKPDFKFTKYKYPPGSTSNSKEYKFDLGLKKYIVSTNNFLEAGYWYKWKDYRYKKDIQQWALRLSFEIRF